MCSRDHVLVHRTICPVLLQRKVPIGFLPLQRHLGPITLLFCHWSPLKSHGMQQIRAVVLFFSIFLRWQLPILTKSAVTLPVLLGLLFIVLLVGKHVLQRHRIHRLHVLHRLRPVLHIPYRQQQLPSRLQLCSSSPHHLRLSSPILLVHLRPGPPHRPLLVHPPLLPLLLPLSWVPLLPLIRACNRQKTKCFNPYTFELV